LLHAPQHLLALIEGVGKYERQTGLVVAEGLREFYVSGDVSPDWLARLRASTAPDPWVHGFAVVHRDSGPVIGSVGFKAPPDGQGVVEIAYGIVPGYRGRGYATEAARAGVEFAFADGRVRVVRAHTLSTPNASTQVLAKLGFERVGEVVDPEDGPVWRWEKRSRQA
jgi:RimJ/RimL family protein N-acetyltransferase